MKKDEKNRARRKQWKKRKMHRKFWLGILKKAVLRHKRR
jgi:hypothetical protein